MDKSDKTFNHLFLSYQVNRNLGRGGKKKTHKQTTKKGCFVPLHHRGIKKKGERKKKSPTLGWKLSGNSQLGTGALIVAFQQDIQRINK